MARVANRVRQGGHNIPESDIRRRFESGLKNFLNLYQPLTDGWWLYDGSRIPPAIIAEEENGQMQISQPDLYDQICTSVKRTP